MGLRIAQAILENKSDSPILVVCYTNHALDQFLEGILLLTTSVVRIGGNSKSDLLNQFSLSNVKRKWRVLVPRGGLGRCMYEAYTNLDELKKQIFEYEYQIARIRDAKRILNREIQWVIAKFAPLQERQLFETTDSSAKNPIDHWLGCKMLVREKQQQIDQIASEMQELLLQERRVEMDGDEEEISHIQNSRMADWRVDNDLFKEAAIEIEREDEEIEYVDADDDMDDDGFRFTKKQMKRQRFNVRIELKSEDKMDVIEASKVDDIWALTNKDRWRLYRWWVSLLLADLQERTNKKRHTYAEKCKYLRALQNIDDVQVVSQRKVIGMTTTGAAKYRHIIDGVRPQIVSKY